MSYCERSHHLSRALLRMNWWRLSIADKFSSINFNWYRSIYVWRGDFLRARSFSISFFRSNVMRPYFVEWPRAMVTVDTRRWQACNSDNGFKKVRWSTAPRGLSLRSRKNLIPRKDLRQSRDFVKFMILDSNDSWEGHMKIEWDSISCVFPPSPASQILLSRSCSSSLLSGVRSDVLQR